MSYLNQLLAVDVIDIIPYILEMYGDELGISNLDELELEFEKLLDIKARKRRYLLTDLIISNIKHDEGLSVIIKGRKGVGKSTYMIKTTVQYFMQYMGLDPGEAYFETLKRIIHTAREFRIGIHRYRDILLWDDAGVWLSTYFWYDRDMRPYLIWFLNWYDTSRTTIHNLIFTTLTPKKLPPRVREDIEAIHARVRRVGSKYIDNKMFKVSNAHLILIDEYDYSTQTYSEDIGEDQFVVFLPEPCYKIYRVLRKAYDVLAEQKLSIILREKGLLGSDELGSNIPVSYIYDDNDDEEGDHID